MPFSFHSHSGEFCLHAEDTLESVVKSAINNGFTHYGLSEHMPRIDERDLYEEEKHLKPDHLMEMFDKFVKKARQLQQKYSTRINITVGMETEYIDKQYVSFIKEMQTKYQLDYLVGSLHHSCELPFDLSEENFKDVVESKGFNTLLRDYFDNQLKLMKAIRPAIIGHFDIIYKYDDKSEIPTDIMEIIKRNIDFGVSYGALFELNSSTFGYEKNHPYPRADILKLIIERNGKLTISDDAHSSLAVGQYYDQLYDCIKRLGICKIYYLNYNHQMKTVSECCESKILHHPFWKTFNCN